MHHLFGCRINLIHMNRQWLLQLPIRLLCWFDHLTQTMSSLFFKQPTTHLMYLDLCVLNQTVFGCQSSLLKRHTRLTTTLYQHPTPPCCVLRMNIAYRSQMRRRVSYTLSRYFHWSGHGKQLSIVPDVLNLWRHFVKGYGINDSSIICAIECRGVVRRVYYRG